MTRTEKLQPVVKHVDSKEQLALQAVAFSQQQMVLQQARLQQLEKYRDDYASQPLNPLTGSYSAVQFQEFNRFLTQLDDTIKRQQQVVALARREVELKRQKWVLSRSRSDAMHKVVDRIQAGELKQAERVEQKFMDEVALRNTFKKL